MKKLVFILFTCFFMGTTSAQEVVKLWAGAPPTSNGVIEKEKNVNDRISDVTDPDITIYLPSKEKNKRIALIICPGGGYARLASQHEGHQFAEWLKSEGYAAMVLKYRLPNKHKTVPLEDFSQAIVYIRSHSADLGIDKVGVAGFSAGGHLASTASTHFTEGTRPDFSVLFYPVITMDGYTHSGSKNNLLGDNPSEEDIYMYSNDKQVDKNTPPAILLLSDDDKTVPSVNSVMYYQALKKNNVPATMYIFPSGGHGWGIRENFLYHSEMKSLLLSWLSTLE